ncbi:uncharacterized protein LOC131315517 isoform X2 [Rhododendron vialii]|uniref:uncharacterized protein LOC131315517 isoform X2 n=1 Tax=Rhododendron vialii TaxID=182163 RepID=UPI00265EAB2F|nr:uncharacterized protein LOC131315517 isoform X2 [Rhododendron vialii]
MASEDFFLNLSPLPSPRWSPLRLTPSPPRPFLPSSSSMVMQYQGCNQSMDDPPQKQEHDHIVDPPPYLAGDSALLQQQLRKNNQGFEELNMGFEEESEKEMMNCFYFPPSPTYFPLYRQMPTVFFVSTSNIQDISLALSCQHIIEAKSGALHVLNAVERRHIVDLLIDGYKSYVVNKFGDLYQTARAAGVVPEVVESLLDTIVHELTLRTDGIEMTLRRINWLEQHDEDMVDQPVFEVVGVAQQLIQNKGGELDVIFGGGVCMINGLERRDSQGTPTTPETLLICPVKHSVRLWLGHGGQWAAEARYRCNRLNIGSFTTVEDAISAYELVRRQSGWIDLTGFPGLFENGNRSKLPPQLPPTAQEEKRGEDFGLVRCNATGNDEIEAVGTGSEGTGECVLADQARLNSVCLEKRKTKEKNPRGEKRNQKTNGVRIAIPLENILQTKGMRCKDAAKHLKVSITKLKSSCREYGIQRWPPHNEHKLIRQSLPNATPAVVDQEGIPHLTSDIVPSNQALKATVDTNNFFEKEILLPQLLPTTQQENPDVGFDNDEDEAIGMEVAGTMEGAMVEAQLYYGCSGNGKWKEKSPRGERGKNRTTGVRIAIAKEDILQTKGMRLKDAAKHLEVSMTKLKSSCREYGIQRWPPHNEHKLIRQSLPNATPAVVDQEGIPHLSSDIVPSNQASMATVDTNNFFEKEILLPQLLPTARQENLDVGFGNDEDEAIGMEVVGTMEGVMVEAQLYFGCSGNGKWKEKSPGGERGKNGTTGVKIAIAKEDILQTKGMHLKDAAKHLEVSRSTFKRACREHGIERWPPHKERELISQSHSNKSSAVVDQERTPQLNSNTLLPSAQVSDTIGTNIVTIMARYGEVRIKFRLSWPWRMVELEQQVKKRLPLEAGTYYIKYKDEDDGLMTLIACDEDLEDYISSSSRLGTHPIEVFLEPKLASS